MQEVKEERSIYYLPEYYSPTKNRVAYVAIEYIAYLEKISPSIFKSIDDGGINNSDIREIVKNIKYEIFIDETSEKVTFEPYPDDTSEDRYQNVSFIFAYLCTFYRDLYVIFNKDDILSKTFELKAKKYNLLSGLSVSPRRLPTFNISSIINNYSDYFVDYQESIIVNNTINNELQMWYFPNNIHNFLICGNYIADLLLPIANTSLHSVLVELMHKNSTYKLSNDHPFFNYVNRFEDNGITV